MKHIFKKLHIGHNHHGSNEALGSSPGHPEVCAPSDHRPTTSGVGSSPSGQTSVMTSTVVTTTTASSSPLPSPAAQLDGRAGDFMMSEEEFQVQLAMAISASKSEYGGGGGGSGNSGGDAAESDEIRAATLFSLGGARIRKKEEASAEALSRQYWVS